MTAAIMSQPTSAANPQPRVKPMTTAPMTPTMPPTAICVVVDVNVRLVSSAGLAALVRTMHAWWH